MKENFTRSFNKIIGVEGKYSNNPNDSGGETMYGITVAVARRHGYTGNMISMPVEVARDIYFKDYWNPNSLESISDISYPIAEEMFDTGVNCGQVVAARFMRDGLNCFNRSNRVQPDYEEVAPEGLVDRAVLAAFGKYMVKRGKVGEMVLLRFLNSLQGAHYNELRKRRIKDEEFVFGWFVNRVI